MSRPGSIRSQFSAEERVARAVARMGPSIVLSTLTETTAFALGALVPMPAVRNFALYAAGSVFVGACLQATAFVSALALDLRRAEARRVDCIPCITLGGGIALEGEESERDGVVGLKVRESFMTSCVRRYAVVLMKRPVKALVMVAFAGIFVLSVVSMQKIGLGLGESIQIVQEQTLMPCRSTSCPPLFLIPCPLLQCPGSTLCSWTSRLFRLSRKRISTHKSTTALRQIHVLFNHFNRQCSRSRT
jgi:Niemann-Pick C1 protein